ncbi:hypothetical protein EsDP_00004709 [Epichloe bromicola]|uniref:PPM-type phosphatase domain-containing protein n=1 Tax=Epichloe bromicola TaxID=79588 RepID=A0ABQ0CSI1_9HYPO
MLRTLRVRLRLVRAFQAQAPHHGFTKASRPTRASSHAAGYGATASAIAAIGAWWSIGTPDDAPRLESRPDQRVVVELDPSKAEVTRILSQEAYSFIARNVPGVERYDGARLASNSPCEDGFTHGLVSPWHNGSSPWVALALFDGHSGWQTADFLEKNLIASVRHSLSRIKPPPDGGATPERTLQGAIMRAFVHLDNSIIKTAEDGSESDQPLQEKVRRFAPAFAGSCALLSLYDPTTSRLHVACTGD